MRYRTTIFEADSSTLNLRKYGWVPAPEKNFSDDGSYFRVYVYQPEGVNSQEESNFELTRTSDKDYAYISISYTNPITKRVTYIDDLNGVPKEDAVRDFPSVMNKVKALYDKEKSSEGPGGRSLTDKEMDNIISTATEIAGNKGETGYSAYHKALQRLEIDKKLFPDAQEREMIKKIDANIRNSRTVDSEVVKKLAALYMEKVLERMRTGYGYNRQWQKGSSLEDALASTTGAYTKDASGKYIHLTDLSDSLQQKIRDWAKARIEKLYDFDE